MIELNANSLSDNINTIILKIYIWKENKYKTILYHLITIHHV